MICLPEKRFSPGSNRVTQIVAIYEWARSLEIPGSTTPKRVPTCSNGVAGCRSAFIGQSLEFD